MSASAWRSQFTRPGADAPISPGHSRAGSSTKRMVFTLRATWDWPFWAAMTRITVDSHRIRRGANTPSEGSSNSTRNGEPASGAGDGRVQRSNNPFLLIFSVVSPELSDAMPRPMIRQLRRTSIRDLVLRSILEFIYARIYRFGAQVTIPNMGCIRILSTVGPGIAISVDDA